MILYLRFSCKKLYLGVVLFVTRDIVEILRIFYDIFTSIFVGSLILFKQYFILRFIENCKYVGISLLKYFSNDF